MASTNKTTHYNLDQYISTDKPTYLTDYNNDMSAIDTGIYNAQTKADNAYTLANSADGKADNAVTTANSALTNAGTANTNIGVMANLETTEKSTLVGAINEVKGDAEDNKARINNFNLTSFNHYTDNDITNGTGDLYVALNADGSLAKIYGAIATAGYPSTGTVTISTPLRPTSDIVIHGGCIQTTKGSGLNVQGVSEKGYTIKTNGNIEFTFAWADGNTSGHIFSFVNSLIFVKDFGDVPTPEPNA